MSLRGLHVVGHTLNSWHFLGSLPSGGIKLAVLTPRGITALCNTFLSTLSAGHVLAEFGVSRILSEYPVYTHVHRKIRKRLSSSFRRDLINVLRARGRIATLFISYIPRGSVNSRNVKQYRLCARPKFRTASLLRSAAESKTGGQRDRRIGEQDDREKEWKRTRGTVNFLVSSNFEAARNGRAHWERGWKGR